MAEAHMMARRAMGAVGASRRGLPWSSAGARLEGHDDGLVNVGPLLVREADWPGFLDRDLDEGFHRALRLSERTGRPRGSDGFVARPETALDREIRPKKPGPKPASRVS